MNAGIALAVRAIRPDQPVYSERASYEYVGRNGFGPDCPQSVYCYRVLVPMVLEQIPLPAE